ncbi:MAG: hypothetical protein SF172_13375 [Burkholderiales bacterium]|nr:hypothetical protein [Burkholderiales bacterium]
MPTVIRAASILSLVLMLSACASSPFTEKRLVQSPRPYFALLKDAEQRYEKLAGTPSPELTRALHDVTLYRSWLGDEEGSLLAFDRSLPRGKPFAPQSTAGSFPQDIEVEPAIQTIVREAAKHQIVILNESHHRSMHRAFALKVALELRKLGFTYLAVETLNTAAPNGFARMNRFSGFYSQDPVFAEFLREAKDVGYELVAYEHIPKATQSGEQDISEREEGQARNLISAVLDKNPAARVLVFVGFSHVMESPQSPKLEWMASRLKRLTDIDPLTIDQTTLMRGGVFGISPVYEFVLRRHAPTVPVTLKSAHGQPIVVGQFQGKVDLQVLHPDYPTAHGRPGWLASLAGRKPHPIPIENLPQSGRRLIKAMHDDDSESDGVPLDMVIVEAGKAAPMLMLPARNFRILFED